MRICIEYNSSVFFRILLSYSSLRYLHLTLNKALRNLRSKNRHSASIAQNNSFKFKNCLQTILFPLHFYYTLFFRFCQYVFLNFFLFFLYFHLQSKIIKLFFLDSPQRRFPLKYFLVMKRFLQFVLPSFR